MGTFVAIEATAQSEALAASAIDEAFAAISDVERRMHPSREGSDVARVNAARPDEKTPIHSSTAEVLSLALLLHELTDGVFDPCLPDRAGRLADLELERSSSITTTVHVVARAPLLLDLGGIAKGYAIDCAVEALRTAGCSAGLVNAGGDLRLFGDRRETILVRSADSRYWSIVLRNAALAVSDLSAIRRPAEHRSYYIRTDDRRRGERIDPAPAARGLAAVLASDAMRADALTKCVLLCPEESAHRALAALGGRSVDPAALAAQASGNNSGS